MCRICVCVCVASELFLELTLTPGMSTGATAMAATCVCGGRREMCEGDIFLYSQQQNSLSYNLSVQGIGTVAIGGPRLGPGSDVARVSERISYLLAAGLQS